MKYSLRSLMIVVLVLPPLIAATWFFVFGMSPHDKAVTLQLLFMVLIAVAALAVGLRIGAARRL